MSASTLKVINKLLNLIETSDNHRWKIKNEMKGLKLVPIVTSSNIEEVYEDGDSSIVIKFAGSRYKVSNSEYPSQYSQIHRFMTSLINKTLSNKMF